MKSKETEIKKFAEKQITYLCEEERINGGYSEWYDALKSFRKHIRKKYISFGISNMYFPKYVYQEESGDIIDHHSISYLAPLDFTRIGWNGLRTTPQEHVCKLSEYFKTRKTRFVYVALPNKGMVNLSLLGDEKLLSDRSGNAPQYRKYIKNVIMGGGEVIDMLPVFETHKMDNRNLFSKGHHISSYGAKLTGETIAKYLINTTKGISPQIKIYHDANCEYFADVGNPEELKIIRDKYYILDEKGVKTCYWNQCTDESKILIFGDCNLQAHTSYGGGITQSLAYSLQYPVCDGGRKLIFGYMDNPIKQEDIKRFSSFEIIIYVAFASAPYVRTAKLLRRRPSLEYKWVNFNL